MRKGRRSPFDVESGAQMTCGWLGTRHQPVAEVITLPIICLFDYVDYLMRPLFLFS